MRGLDNVPFCPALIYGDAIPTATQEKFRSDTLRFADQRLDLAAVGAQCDLATLNGSHGTAVSMLLAGKPTLQVPIFLEQLLFTGAFQRLGACIRVPTNRPDLFPRDHR